MTAYTELVYWGFAAIPEGDAGGMTYLYLILTCAFTVGVSLCCSLYESTLLSLSKVRLESEKRDGKAYAEKWLELRKDIDKPIAAILILNTVSNTGGATLAGFLFDEVFGAEWVWLFLMGLTVTILFIAEIGPKVLGAVYCNELAPYLAPPLVFTTRVLTPIIWLTEAFARPFKGKGRKGEVSATTDIEVMAQEARVRNIIDHEQERIIVNTTQLRETEADEVMLPRESIVFFNINRSTEENVKLARTSLHTRYPVSESDSPDSIIGYVNFKEIFAMEPRERSPNLDPFIHQVLFVRPNQDLNHILKLLTARRQHMAIIRTEEMRVIGMITMEDLLEEIVGDIEDELDRGPIDTVELSENLWQIGGGVGMETVAELFEVHIDEETGDLEVAEWFEQLMPHGLAPGMSRDFKDLRFVVRQVRRHRAHQVIVERITPELVEDSQETESDKSIPEVEA